MDKDAKGMYKGSRCQLTICQLAMYEDIHTLTILKRGGKRKKDPDNKEYEELLDWVGEDFDPEHFDTAEVRFSDLGKRFKFAFE